MRTNKDGQGSRAQNGASFQRLIFNKLAEFMESSGLDQHFELRGKKRLRIPIEDNGKSKTIAPDQAFVCRATGALVVVFGNKKSFHERWKTDDRDAILAKKHFPGIVWIEVTDHEEKHTSTERIVRKLRQLELESDFDLVCSTAVPESMTAMFAYVKTIVANLISPNLVKANN